MEGITNERIAQRIINLINSQALISGESLKCKVEVTESGFKKDKDNIPYKEIIVRVPYTEK